MGNSKVPVTSLRLFKYFAYLGATGFGGPLALAAYMERDLVEVKKWITKEEYVEGFALAQLSPGPLAAQLAIYLGWVRGGIWGATLAGVGFVIPSFLICVLLALAYIKYQSLPWIQYVSYSVSAAIVGIMIHSAGKLVRRTTKNNKILLGIAAISAIYTASSESESLTIFLLGGLLNLVVATWPFRNEGSSLKGFLPLWLFSGLQGSAETGTLKDMALFFSKAGAFVFGSGLAIVPFLYGGVVNQHHWLNDRQFLDAVAIAMITPGPVVITVAFIGYLTAGFTGALIAAGATFLPCYLLTVIPAPYFSRIAKFPKIKYFVEGITVAAIGAIIGAVWVLGKRAIVDIPTFFIGGIVLLLVIKTKVPEPLWILAAALLGLILQHSTRG
jgi:chromate transporter